MSAQKQQQGSLFVLAAGSGTGKTTVCKLLLQHWEHSKSSVSFTTREARTGEEHGKEYYFISHEVFNQMIKQNEFLEWAEVHGQKYGTGLKVTEELLQKGHDILLDIDIQGARSIKQIFAKQAILIFLLPPSWEAMKQRLQDRKTETIDKIQQRLQTARTELPAAREFDYIVVNDVLKETLLSIESIRAAEKYKSYRQEATLQEILYQITSTDKRA